MVQRLSMSSRGVVPCRDEMKKTTELVASMNVKMREWPESAIYEMIEKTGLEG